MTELEIRSPRTSQSGRRRTPSTTRPERLGARGARGDSLGRVLDPGGAGRCAARRERPRRGRARLRHGVLRLLARPARSARVTGVDPTPAQLATARRMMQETGRGVHARGGAGRSGAAAGCSVRSRCLRVWGVALGRPKAGVGSSRPRGCFVPADGLVFLTNATLVYLCAPDNADEMVGRKLLRDQFGMYRIQWGRARTGIEYHPRTATGIKVLRENGFEIEALHRAAPAPRGGRPRQTTTTSSRSSGRSSGPQRRSGSAQGVSIPAVAAVVVSRPRSPQRRAILTQLGILFDEVALRYERARSAGCRRAARRTRPRARQGAPVAGEAGDRPALGVDTTVFLDGRIYAEAEGRRAMQSACSRSRAGRTHAVVSGIAPRHPAWEHVDDATTLVTFRQADAARPRVYIGFGEWEGRAAAATRSRATAPPWLNESRATTRTSSGYRRPFGPPARREVPGPLRLRLMGEPNPGEGVSSFARIQSRCGDSNSDLSDLNGARYQAALHPVSGSRVPEAGWSGGGDIGDRRDLSARIAACARRVGAVGRPGAVPTGCRRFVAPAVLADGTRGRPQARYAAP